ncbi:MAG: (Fe-S)-binding protein [Desulforegulaceae bacterium]|nr:(Fe-S)-binding protein [Desulforegulaceae bacterium]
MKISFYKKPGVNKKFLELNEIFSAADSCRKCGKCQSVCPVFRQTGFEQHTARGKLTLINGLKNNFFFNPSLIEKHLRFCLLCGRCERSCPSGIDTLSVFLKARTAMNEFDKKSFLKRFLIRVFVKFPFLFKLFKRTNNSNLNNYQFEKVNEKKLIFFTGCLFDRVFEDTTKRALDFFKSSGFDPVIVDDECCGLPFLTSGDKKGFVKAGDKLYGKFLNSGSNLIVSGCPTCISALKNLWPDFFEFGKEFNRNFEVLDFHQFAARVIKENKFEFKGKAEEKIKWHLPCHLKSLGGEKDAEYVLKKCLNFKPLQESKLNSSCGFGGTFSIDHPGISKKILDKKAGDLSLKEGEVLVTGCPACVLQLERIKRAGNKKRVFHTIDLIGGKQIKKF